MKFLVCSDSHGAVRPLLGLVRGTAPDCLLFLGDGIRDVCTVLAAHPSLPALCVAGNNDAYDDTPTQRTALLCGKRVFMAHGHTYGVKRGLWRLIAAARLSRADIAFGHTHTPLPYEGMLAVNPAALPRLAPHPCAAVDRRGVRRADGCPQPKYKRCLWPVWCRAYDMSTLLGGVFLVQEIGGSDT